MIPCKSKFSCIGFPKHLIGMTSLLQYKIFSRMQLLNNNNEKKTRHNMYKIIHSYTTSLFEK
jgi:hypothetical protein